MYVYAHQKEVWLSVKPSGAAQVVDTGENSNIMDQSFHGSQSAHTTQSRIKKTNQSWPALKPNCSLVFAMCFPLSEYHVW